MRFVHAVHPRKDPNSVVVKNRCTLWKPITAHMAWNMCSDAVNVCVCVCVSNLTTQLHSQSGRELERAEVKVINKWSFNCLSACLWPTEWWSGIGNVRQNGVSGIIFRAFFPTLRAVSLKRRALELYFGLLGIFFCCAGFLLNPPEIMGSVSGAPHRLVGCRQRRNAQVCRLTNEWDIHKTVTTVQEWWE